MFNFTGLNTLLYLLRRIKGRFATKDELNEVFTSVSNGKQLIASAITDKGVETANDATFLVMAENIGNIPSGVKVPLKNVGDANIVYDSDESTIINWSDPEDEVVNDVMVSEWAGTKVIRKLDSVPENENDGELVVDSKVKNQYLENGFVDTGLVLDNLYNYMFYPYNKNNVFNKGFPIEYLHSKVLSETLGYNFKYTDFGTKLGNNIVTASPARYMSFSIIYANSLTYISKIIKYLYFPNKLDKNLYNKITISGYFETNGRYSHNNHCICNLIYEDENGNEKIGFITQVNSTKGTVCKLDIDFDADYETVSNMVNKYILGVSVEFYVSYVSTGSNNSINFNAGNLIFEISNKG